MKKFHITITNNNTGESILDTNSDAIIGAVEEDDGVDAMAFTSCDIKIYAQTIAIAQKVVNKLLKEDKNIKPIVRMMTLLLKKSEDT